MANNLKQELQEWLVEAKKIVVAGIGNPIRTDDYVGLKIAENLTGKVRKNVCILECETVPESHLLEIEQFQPSHVLLIDSALLGFAAGEVNLFDADKISIFSPVSSHVLPLRVFCEYVKATTGAKISLLLIEPKITNFGEGLSDVLQLVTDKLTAILLDLLD